MRSRDIDQVILELASRTASVVHARDLRAAGIGREAVAERRRRGWMAPILALAYGVGPMCRAPSFEMRCMAAQLSGGPRSVIDGETAAVLHDAWNRASETVHVTVPGRVLRDPPIGYQFHRAGRLWVPTDPAQVGPVPVAGFRDMCVRFAQGHTEWQLAFVITRGIYLGLGTLASLETVVIERARMPGNATLRAAVELVASGSVGTRSRTEDGVLGDLLASGVPVPVVNTRGAMGLSRDEPDFIWPGFRLNLEVDGGHHDDRSQAIDDQRRDAEAQELGWRVLRIRPRDFWRRRAHTVRGVLRFLEAGGLRIGGARGRRSSGIA